MLTSQGFFFVLLVGGVRTGPGFERDSLKDFSAQTQKYPPAVGITQQDSNGLVIILNIEGEVRAFQLKRPVCFLVPNNVVIT